MLNSVCGRTVCALILPILMEINNPSSTIFKTKGQLRVKSLCFFYFKKSKQDSIIGMGIHARPKYLFLHNSKYLLLHKPWSAHFLNGSYINGVTQFPFFTLYCDQSNVMKNIPNIQYCYPSLSTLRWCNLWMAPIVYMSTTQRMKNVHELCYQHSFCQKSQVACKT